jgi:16S rRNA processing protein RimM
MKRAVRCAARRKEYRMEQYLKIGVITTTHGVRGEVKVFPTTDDAGRFLDLDEVMLCKNGKTENHEIENVKFFKNQVILKLSGITSMNDAELYRNWEIFIPREEGVDLEEDEYYQADLIGLTVYTEDGSKFGVLKEIIETGANDVYVVKTQTHGEVLIPAIKDCIIDVNIEEGHMTVHLMPGILDL